MKQQFPTKSAKLILRLSPKAKGTSLSFADFTGVDHFS